MKKKTVLSLLNTKHKLISGKYIENACFAVVENNKQRLKWNETRLKVALGDRNWQTFVYSNCLRTEINSYVPG